MRRGAVVTLVVLGLTGCLLFTERPQASSKSDAGSGTSGGEENPPPPDSATNPTCSITLPPAGSCTGPGGLQTGRFELEPNDPANPETVFVGDDDDGPDITTVLCGALGAGDTQDSFQFKVTKADCWEVAFKGANASVHVHGPGVERSATPDTKNSIEFIQFNVNADGNVAIDVTGSGDYVFSIR